MRQWHETAIATTDPAASLHASHPHGEVNAGREQPDEYFQVLLFASLTIYNRHVQISSRQCRLPHCCRGGLWALLAAAIHFRPTFCQVDQNAVALLILQPQLVE